MNFLQGQLFGLPTWLVLLIVGGGGIALALFIRGRSQQSSGNTLGQNTQSTPLDPNIDPNTGVPYAVEETVNPNTGNLNYYNPVPTPPPNPPVGQPTQGPTCPPGTTWDPSTGRCIGDANPPHIPVDRLPGQGGPTPGTIQPWWYNLLTTGPGASPGQHTYYMVPSPMSLNAISRQFGITWEGIAYNPNNKNVEGGQFLSNSYQSRGGNVVPAGTALWIPTSTLSSSPPAQGGAGGAQLRRSQSTPFWPIMSDLPGAA